MHQEFDWVGFFTNHSDAAAVFQILPHATTTGGADFLAPRTVRIGVNIAHHDDVTIARQVNVGGDAVCVLPFDPALKRVVMVQEPCAGPLLLKTAGVHPSLVSGKVEHGEGIDQAALRELKEETGFEGTYKNTIFENIMASPTTNTLRLSLVYVEVDTNGHPPVGQWRINGDEYTRPLMVPLDVFVRLDEIRKGNIGLVTYIAIQHMRSHTIA